MISGRGYEALVASIYEAAGDFGRWPEVLHSLARAFDAPAVVFASFGCRAADLWQMAPEVDPAQMDLYAAHYHSIDPLWRIALQAGPGLVATDAMLLPRRDFEQTEFYNDFLLPQDFGSMLGAGVHTERSRCSYIVVQRRRPFGPAEIALQRRLAPHLRCAVGLNVRLAALDMRCTGAAEALDRLDVGAILVSAESRVLFANREAEGLLRPGEFLRIVDGVLCSRSAAKTASLHRAVARCRSPCGDDAAGEALTLAGPEGRKVGVTIVPLRTERPPFLLLTRPAAIVFVTDPSREPVPLTAQAQKRYGLTRAETAFASEIAKGDGIQACADRLGIARSTARTHLAHIFEKTGVGRQAELVRLFLRL